MKDKKIKETIKETKDLAEKAVNAMQKLSEDELNDIAGAGNPFVKVPRVPTQPIDDDMRNNG